jgi:hypothetical protein
MNALCGSLNEQLMTLVRAVELTMLQLLRDDESRAGSDLAIDELTELAVTEAGCGDGPIEIVLQLIGIELSERAMAAHAEAQNWRPREEPAT